MLTMDKALLIIEGAIEKAKKIGQPMNIAIVDAGANLMAFMRMDGAWLGSIDRINKAFTARVSISRHSSLAATASLQPFPASTIEPRPGIHPGGIPIGQQLIVAPLASAAAVATGPAVAGRRSPSCRVSACREELQ
jgi:uncharacterized protein GlcG (DUF336 family)